jgi:hypothetical protein
MIPEDRQEASLFTDSRIKTLSPTHAADTPTILAPVKVLSYVFDILNL